MVVIPRRGTHGPPPFSTHRGDDQLTLRLDSLPSDYELPDETLAELARIIRRLHAQHAHGAA